MSEQNVEFYKRQADRIRKQCSDWAEINVLENGVSAKIYNTQIKLAFYYRSKKYHLNTTGQMIKFTLGNENKVISKYRLQVPNKKLENKIEKPLITQVSSGSLMIKHIEKKLSLYIERNDGK